MALVIQGILNESRIYYRDLKRGLVGQLLLNAKGSFASKHIGGNDYAYLRRNVGNKRLDTYLGPLSSPLAQAVTKSLEDRRNNILELRKVKSAMKELKTPMKEITEEDYFPLIRTLFDKFSDEGLWDEGIELIGSWCFKVYQNHCGVEYYPERTLDVDFAVPLPYRGKRLNVGELLVSMGFQERMDYRNDSVHYISGEFKVEFLKDRVGDGKKRKDDDSGSDLGLAPQALPYLGILLKNPMVLSSQDVGKVRLPSMPAFMLHKLLVADERTRIDKKEKDYRHVEAVARVLAGSPEAISEIARIAEGMHKKWVTKMLKSYKQMEKYLRRPPEATRAVLVQAGLLETGPV